MNFARFAPGLALTLIGATLLALVRSVPREWWIPGYLWRATGVVKPNPDYEDAERVVAIGMRGFFSIVTGLVVLAGILWLGFSLFA